MKISEFLSPFALKLKETLAIPAGESAYDSLHSIRDNVEVRGLDFWILFCGAMLASLGLDVNSAAVIIGAMLVSPLMSPILGIGVGIGVNDKPFLMLSLKNFGIAVLYPNVEYERNFYLRYFNVRPDIVKRSFSTSLVS